MTIRSPHRGNFAGGQRLTGGQTNGALGALAKVLARTASLGQSPVAAVTTTQPTVTGGRL